jgi:hypothetical protein
MEPLGMLNFRSNPTCEAGFPVGSRRLAADGVHYGDRHRMEFDVCQAENLLRRLDSHPAKFNRIA